MSEEKESLFSGGFIFQWGEWLWDRRKMNWQSFTFIAIEVEREPYVSSRSWEGKFVVLGVGFWVSYHGGVIGKELSAAIAEMDQIKAGLRDGLSEEEVGLKRLCPECFQVIE